jgi:hypothetical protein
MWGKGGAAGALRAARGARAGPLAATSRRHASLPRPRPASATPPTSPPLSPPPPAVFAREPRHRLIVQGATDTVVIGLTGVAIGTSSAAAHALGWVPFISIYMGVNGALLVLALCFAGAGLWRRWRSARLEARVERQLELGGSGGGGAPGGGAAV